MVITNQDIRCKTMDDLLRVLKSAAPDEDKIKCLEDMGITDIDKYMTDLRNSIREKKKRKKELENILELEKNKNEYLDVAAAELILGLPFTYFAYIAFSYVISPVNESGVLGGMLIGGISGLIGLTFLYDAYENIRDYIKAKYIEHKRGKINIEELEKELRVLEKDINKNKKLYILLDKYRNKIF